MHENRLWHDEKKADTKKELDDNIGASSIFFSVVENV
jgi:hypothetical protein